MTTKFFRKASKNLLKLVAPLVRNDRWFVETMYWARTGEHMDMDCPRNFNEKIQWLKVFNRHEHQHALVDKYAVKDIVAQRIGEQYVIPTFGVWDNPDDIDFDALPERFVLKATHGWGGNSVFVCTDKATFDKKKVVKQLKKALRKQNYAKLREWAYKDIPPRVIAEKFIGTESGDVPVDYKFYCFDGKALYVMACVGRVLGSMKPKYYFFDRQWRFCPIHKNTANCPSDFTVPPPDGFEKMIELAEKLSEGEPHVRVDFYDVDGQIYFGEITYYSYSGYANFTPEGNRCLGDCIKLPPKSYRP